MERVSSAADPGNSIPGGPFIHPSVSLRGRPLQPLSRLWKIGVVSSASPASGRAVRVFVSYSHDSEPHRDRVLGLARQLRDDGIDCQLDRFSPAPPQGWRRWMHEEFSAADFILVICSAPYRQRFETMTPTRGGQGSQWESTLIAAELYERRGYNRRIIPVMLDTGASEDVPVVLRDYACYRVPADYLALYRHLTGQAAVAVPPIGAMRLLTEALPAPASGAGVPVVAPHPVAESPTVLAAPRYDPWTPARGEMFFGRGSLLLRIGSAIAESRSVSVVGDWRIGKSSLLQRLLDDRAGRSTQIIMVSGEDEAGASYSTFVESVTGGRKPPDDPDEAAGVLSEWSGAWTSPPVIVVDEFDGMASRFDPRFFERLRGMLGRIILILSSRRELDLIYADVGRTSPFYNRLETVWVGLLDEAAAAQVIAAATARLALGDRRLAAEWAGRHPFYLQLICKFLIEAQAEGAGPETALDRFRTVADPRLRDVIRTLTPAERRELAKVASGGSSSKRSLRVRGLVNDNGMPFGRVLSEFLRDEDF